MKRETSIGVVVVLVFLTLAAQAVAQEMPQWARQASDTSKIRVFIRGDDFGSSHSSNIALSEGLDSGVLGWTSIMVVGPWIAETVRLLEQYPNVSIGLHLTLTSEWDQFRWRPILSAAEVPTLLAPDGAFFKNYWRNSSATQQQLATLEPQTRAQLARIMAEELPVFEQAEAELRAQVQRARDLGLRIQYIDCHMGVACLPEFRPIMFELAEELCVPIPEHGWMGHEEIGFRIVEDPVVTIQNLRDLLLNLRPGLHRIVTHPAADTPEARAMDSVYREGEAKRRQAVLLALRSEAIREVIAQRNIELVSVQDLWDSSTCQLKH